MALAAAGLAAALAGCASVPANAPHFATRELSQAEKTVLRSSLGRAMKDPDATQIKWLPAIVPGPDAPMDQPVGYCGLVNGKNSFGGYVGFRRFFATVQRNAKGEYDRGTIEHIEGTPITFGGDSTWDDAIETGTTEGLCQKWGYTDFSGAN